MNVFECITLNTADPLSHYRLFSAEYHPPITTVSSGSVSLSSALTHICLLPTMIQYYIIHGDHSVPKQPVFHSVCAQSQLEAWAT